VGALLGVLSVLFFVMARAALRGATQNSKNELQGMKELERLQLSNQLIPMSSSLIDRHNIKR